MNQCYLAAFFLLLQANSTKNLLTITFLIFNLKNYQEKTYFLDIFGILRGKTSIFSFCDIEQTHTHRKILNPIS